MQQQINQPEQAQLNINMGNWFDVASTLRGNFTIDTFLTLLNHSDARSQYAYVWVSITQLLFGIVVGVTTTSDVASVIFLGLFFMISGTIGFILQNWLVQRLAIAYDGNPDGYRMLHYGRGIYKPITTGILSLVFLLSALVPAVQFLTSWIVVIDVLLMVIVLQHVNNFSYLKSSLLTIGIYFGSVMLLQIFLGGLL